MIEKITGAGAAVVALDILLYDPGDPEDDAKLAKAMEGRPVVLGQFLTNEGGATALPDKAGFAYAGDDPSQFANGFRGVMTPLPALLQAAAGVGFLNWLPDNDRVVRRVPLVLTVDGKLTPSFAMEALRVAQGASTYTIKSSNASGEYGFGARTGMVAIQNGDAIIPSGSRGDFRIHFAGDAENARMRVPAWKLLEPGADLSAFAGAVVLIGVSAQLQYDIVATPLSPNAAGVEQHAEIIGQVLANDHLTRPDWAKGAEFLYTVALSTTLAVALPFLSTLGGALIGFVATTASLAGSLWAYRSQGVLFDPILPSLGSGIVFISGVLALYGRKRGEEREIRSAFGRYVSPAVVARLAADPSVLQLGGEERRLTLMFSDLRGFTTISEGKSATELTRFLNEYLTPMTDVVLRQLGTVDKYIGDAIMAFWNAPLDDDQHAEHAVLASLGMRDALATLNGRWAREAAAAGRHYSAGQIRRRAEHRRGLRRQSRLIAALRLFGDRRRGQHRLPVGERQQEFRRRHHRQRSDAGRDAGLRMARSRCGGVQEQDAAGRSLRPDGRRGIRREPRLHRPRRRARPHDGALPRPRIRRGAGDCGGAGAHRA